MKILVAKEEFFLDQLTDHPIDEIFSIIHKVAEEKSLIFYGLIINGEAVYDQFAEIITQNLNEIHTIEAILETEEKLLLDTLYSINTYVEQSLPILPMLLEEIYGNLIAAETWGKLGDLVEGIQWIHTTSQYYPLYEGMLDFSEVIESLNTAVMQQDNILIGDIIQYEVVPRYEVIVRSLAKDIQPEVN